MKNSNNTSGRLGTESFDLYAETTQQITDMLDKGVVPWRSPILGRGTAGFPKNLDSKKPYRGVNVFLLAFTAFAKGFSSSYWLTWNQAKAHGGSVMKGEKSTMVVFWKKLEVVDNATGEKKQIPMMRYYRVFNAEQCDGIKPPDAVEYVPPQFQPIEAAEAIVKGYADGPAIEHSGTQAFYRPSTDIVVSPEPTRFVSSAEYFSTLLHELSHSTGAVKRLNRGLGDKLMPFGSPDYGKEELVAEMSASFLCAHAGIVPAVIENQASYISGWLGRLKGDKKLIVHAAAAGQRAADWILGQRQPDAGEGQGSEPDKSPESIVVPELPNGNQSAATNRPQELETAARNYLRRGFAPLPIPAGQKSPQTGGWQNLRLREDDLTEAFKNAGNIGLLLGEPSGGLVDVDLDCPEARELADQFLPPTSAVTGRPSSPQSHRWFICPDAQTMQRRDPVTRGSIVELRSTGAQTLVGPSIHPSGESYESLSGAPARVDAETLRNAVDQLANHIIVQRHGSLPTTVQAIREPPQEELTVDHTELLARASGYLGAMPAAISGQGGHNLTYAAATALVHGFCLAETEAFELLRTQYNPRCEPPWSDRDLAHKVQDAANKPHQRQRGWLISQA